MTKVQFIVRKNFWMKNWISSSPPLSKKKENLSMKMLVIRDYTIERLHSTLSVVLIFDHRHSI